MADVKWIKITTNMFDDEKIKLIDAMPDHDTIFYIWMRLLVQAGKCNAKGYIFLNENVPYTDEMLSTIFNRPLNSIRLALKTLSDLGMIDKSDNNEIKITNWEKYQNIEGMEKIREQNRLRKQKQREKQKVLKEGKNNDVTPMSRDSHATDKERERDKELDIDKDKELDNKRKSKEENSSLSDKAIELCKYWQELIPNQSITRYITTLKTLVERYGFDWTKEAIQITASKKNRFILGYIEVILKNWAKDGKEEQHGAIKQDNETSPYDFSKFGE